MYGKGLNSHVASLCLHMCGHTLGNSNYISEEPMHSSLYFIIGVANKASHIPRCQYWFFIYLASHFHWTFPHLKKNLKRCSINKINMVMALILTILLYFTIQSVHWSLQADAHSMHQPSISLVSRQVNAVLCKATAQLNIL